MSRLSTGTAEAGYFAERSRFAAGGGSAAALTYAETVLADSPRGYWKLDETSGTSMADTSGNSLTGTLTTVSGTGPAVNQTGLVTVGKSCTMASGLNRGYVYVSDNALLDVGDTFTLEAWINLNAVGADQAIIDKGLNGYYMRVGSTNHLELIKSGVALIVTSTNTFSVSTTYHCVITKSGATVLQYVNGADVTGTVSNQTIVDGTKKMFIGYDNSLGDGAGSQRMQGNLDEVAVYGTALSAARVAAHYAARAL